MLVRRADGQTLQVTPLLAAVLEATDGERSHLEVAWEVARTTERVLSADEVRFLVEEKLQPLGLVVGDDGVEPEVERSNPLLALKLRFVVSNPRITNAVTRPFAFLFRSWVVVPVLAAFTALSAWVLFGKGVGSGLHQAFYEPEFLLLVVALTVLSAGFHEFGHAAACRYGGATPGAMGAAIYLVWPAFYTDVSDSYRLDRWGRLRVDLGGLYFNTIFALATFAGWWALRADALLVLVPIQLFQMVRQLLPFVRFDGYHILADLTGVPDLFARIRPTLAGLLPANWGKPEHRVLRPWARAVVTVWVLLVIPMLAFFGVLLVLGLPRLLATAADSLRLQYAALGSAFTDGDVVAVLARLVSLFAIALPPLSALYLVSRLVRSTGRRVWTVAGDHPPYGRPLAAVAFAGLAAFAAVALWPGEQYEPVRAGEGLTLTDGFGLRHSPIVAVGYAALEEVAPRVAAAAPFRGFGPTGVAAMAPTRSEIDGDGGALSLRPPAPEAWAEPAVTAEDPGSSIGARPAWPFPFAPPPAPRAQDNFAVAVNTVDGRTVATMETSMAWLGEARVDHRNRSYALASCVDCTTVAAAYQLVVASGTSRTVIPENAAISVNYECTTCVTHSIAVQTVVTTKTTPPADVRAQVEARYRAAQALEPQVGTLGAGEIRSRLHAIEAEILRLLAPYTKAVETGEDVDAGDDPAEAATPAEEELTSTVAPEPEPSPSSTSTTEAPSSTTTSTTEAPSSTTTSTTEAPSTTTSTTEPPPSTTTTEPPPTGTSDP